MFLVQSFGTLNYNALAKSLKKFDKRVSVPYRLEPLSDRIMKEVTSVVLFY